MACIEYDKEIERHQSQAAKFYYRARKYAHQAEEHYAFAAEMFAHARWLSTRPWLWEYGTPADAEAMARIGIRSGDNDIRHSDFNTNQARFYAKLSRRYAAMKIEFE